MIITVIPEIEILRNDDPRIDAIYGTSLANEFEASYDELFDLLGEATFINSMDDKCQFEWVLIYNDQFYTIYDWKNYGEDITEWPTVEWHVGAASDANEFTNLIQQLIANPPLKVMAARAIMKGDENVH